MPEMETVSSPGGWIETLSEARTFNVRHGESESLKPGAIVGVAADPAPARIVDAVGFTRGGQAVPASDAVRAPPPRLALAQTPRDRPHHQRPASARRPDSGRDTPTCHYPHDVAPATRDRFSSPPAGTSTGRASRMRAATSGTGSFTCFTGRSTTWSTASRSSGRCNFGRGSARRQTRRLNDTAKR